MAVLAFIKDTIFQSKLEAAASRAGVELTVSRDASELTDADWKLMIIDLELAEADALEIIKTFRQLFPKTPVVGFCSHVERELQASAKSSGCHNVLVRSEFVQHLPELMRGGLGLPM